MILHNDAETDPLLSTASLKRFDRSDPRGAVAAKLEDMPLLFMYSCVATHAQFTCKPTKPRFHQTPNAQVGDGTDAGRKTAALLPARLT